MLLSRTWRDTLSVDEPQVLLYFDDMKITPSNPHKAKPPIARVTLVEVPGAGAAPDSSSEAAGAGVRPGIEFWLERVMDEAVQFGPDGEAQHIPGDCSEYSRHVDGWTTAGAAAVERHEAMAVSSALADASSSSGSSSSTTALTKPGVLDQLVFDGGERGSDGAQDLLLKHLQEAEVNEGVRQRVRLCGR